MARHGTFWDSMQRINIVSSAFASLFAFLGLLMTGWLERAVELAQTYSYVPVIAALVSLLIMWASSNTRDPSYYHPAELGIVGGVVGLMLGHAFWPPLAEFVTANNPITGGIMLLLMIVAGAIVMR